MQVMHEEYFVKDYLDEGEYEYNADDSNNTDDVVEPVLTPKIQMKPIYVRKVVNKHISNQRPIDQSISNKHTRRNTKKTHQQVNNQSIPTLKDF